MTKHRGHGQESQVPSASAPYHPAEFTASTVSLDPIRARAAVAVIVARSGRKGPLLTQDDVLDTLADRYGMTATAKIIRRGS